MGTTSNEGIFDLSLHFCETKLWYREKEGDQKIINLNTISVVTEQKKKKCYMLLTRVWESDVISSELVPCQILGITYKMSWFAIWSVIPINKHRILQIFTRDLLLPLLLN